MNCVRIASVVGARPQFIKAAFVSRAMAAFNKHAGKTAIEEQIVHTGQHYSKCLSDVFFQELDIPNPVVNLEIGSGSHGRQTARCLEAMEAALQSLKPDVVIVYGDTNSTLAASLAAVKLGIPVAHVEAGMRCFDRRTPEETNRVVADHVASLLFCSCRRSAEFLAAEGIREGVYVVGDVMLDVFQFATAIPMLNVCEKFDLQAGKYCLVTIHRADNTDHDEVLRGLISVLQSLPYPVILPLHPRTKKALQRINQALPDRVTCVEPVSYRECLALAKHARFVLTDSGGLQKEAYWLKTPCITLKESSSWWELYEAGCNVLAGVNPAAVLRAVAWMEERRGRLVYPECLYGQGGASDSIVRILMEKFS